MAFQGYSGDNHLQKTSAVGLVALDAPQTICAWMYVTNYAGTESAFSVIVGASAAIQIGPRDAGLKVWGWGNALRVLGPATYANTWFHMTWTYDGALNSLYYNAVSATTPTAGTQTGTPDQILFSGYNISASETFTGLLDDVRFYNRVLSLGEIETIYYTSSKDSIVDGLLSRWVFDEKPPGSQITKATDLTGTGNDLVPVGLGAQPPIYVDSIITSKRAIRNCF
jgi:hypothetical protein